MKLLLLALILMSTFAFPAFNPFPPISPPVGSISAKGNLLTSDGSSQSEFLACADGKILEYLGSAAEGLICGDKTVIPPASDPAFVGEIKTFHTFNGTVAIPSGWMVLNGDVVDETNYDAIHGAGAYVADGVAGSVLAGKFLPNMINKYEVAVAATTQDGSGAISSVGNSSNTVNLQHSHTGGSHTHGGANHNHQWHERAGLNNPRSYTSGGGLTEMTALGQASSGLLSSSSTNTKLVGNYYTSNAAGTTGGGGTVSTTNGLSTSQSIQPESIEVIKIMKVI